MKIYIVVGTNEYEPGGNIAMYRTRKSAEKRVKRLQAEKERWHEACESDQFDTSQFSENVYYREFLIEAHPVLP